jgi:hypothetical protein
LQVRVLSLPLDKDVLPGEQSSSNLDAEGSTPSVLAFVSVAEQPRHRPAASDRRVRLPPDTRLRPVTQRVWRPACRAGETGSSPVQGADSGRGRAARQPSDTRFEAGSTPAGPTTQSRGAARSARRAHIAEAAGSNPAGTTGRSPPWPSGDGTSLTWRGPQVRVLPGVLAACGVDWSQVPARPHKPSHAGSNPASATACCGRASARPRLMSPAARCDPWVRDFMVLRCYGRTPPW